MAKYGHFEYVVEYPIWVSIKRYWTGQLALACQNWIYCFRLKENVQKPSKTECFRIQLFLEVLGRFLLNGCSKSNSDGHMAILGHYDHFEGHFLITIGLKISLLRLDLHYPY